MEAPVKFIARNDVIAAVINHQPIIPKNALGVLIASHCQTSSNNPEIIPKIKPFREKARNGKRGSKSGVNTAPPPIASVIAAILSGACLKKLFQ